MKPCIFRKNKSCILRVIAGVYGVHKCDSGKPKWCPVISEVEALKIVSHLSREAQYYSFTGNTEKEFNINSRIHELIEIKEKKEFSKSEE